MLRYQKHWALLASSLYTMKTLFQRYDIDQSQSSISLFIRGIMGSNKTVYECISMNIRF